MAQRSSGYERKERDLYETPAWVTIVLCGLLPRRSHFVWEPAAGTGKMRNALIGEGFSVIASDIEPYEDIERADFSRFHVAPKDVWAIVTNPPYALAESFVRHAIELMRPRRGLVAMLLRVDWDSAKTRRDLFSEHPAFAMKITLLDRIQWFAGGASNPSENHAWFVWDWQSEGREPILRWAANPSKSKKDVQLKLIKGLA